MKSEKRNSPLVTVICLSYNQEKYIFEALTSVLDQDYKAIELIILDNGSTDNTAEQIRTWLWANEEKIATRTLFYARKINYCQAFNKGLSMAKGKYTIDLSGDDILLPSHISHAVSILFQYPDAKVYSSNALYISEKGDSLGTFFAVKKDGATKGWMPQGDVYVEVVARYCVCTPTLVFDKKALESEGGYNEGLVYEDFDIITRMARKYPFVYGDHLGVKKRIHPSAFSKSQYQRKAAVMLHSTWRVCEHIYHMNRNRQEDRALLFRVLHETKHALASANFNVAGKFLALAKRVGGVGNFRYLIYRLWLSLRLDLSWLYEKWAERK